MGKWDRMDFREIGLVGAEWIHLAQDRDWWQAVVNAVMNLWFWCHGVSYACD
jgi:hypothetical protein